MHSQIHKDTKICFLEGPLPFYMPLSKSLLAYAGIFHVTLFKALIQGTSKLADVSRPNWTSMSPFILHIELCCISNMCCEEKSDPYPFHVWMINDPHPHAKKLWM